MFGIAEFCSNVFVYFFLFPETEYLWSLSCRFGAVFLWDTGSQVGDVYGHSKIINSVDIKQKRPYRMVTGSDDTCVCFSEGPPFKFKNSSFVSDSDFFSLKRKWNVELFLMKHFSFYTWCFSYKLSQHLSSSNGCVSITGFYSPVTLCWLLTV